MNIVIMGPQGSGKSTQAELLAEHLNLPHLSTGVLFRDLAESDSPLAERVRGQLAGGHLVSDEDVMSVLGQVLAQPKHQCGFILDGFPRNLWQAEHAPFEVGCVFYLRVSDEESIERLKKRGREDDTDELIRQRLSAYHAETEPVLDYYRRQGILEEVDGERSVEDIFTDILSRLGELK